MTQKVQANLLASYQLQSLIQENIDERCGENDEAVDVRINGATLHRIN